MRHAWVTVIGLGTGSPHDIVMAYLDISPSRVLCIGLDR